MSTRIDTYIHHYTHHNIHDTMSNCNVHNDDIYTNDKALSQDYAFKYYYACGGGGMGEIVVFGTPPLVFELLLLVEGITLLIPPVEVVPPIPVTNKLPVLE
jgi:hypothetical protein